MRATRREVLSTIAAAMPLMRDRLPFDRARPPRSVAFIEEAHGLAQESAKGYRLLIESAKEPVPFPGCVIAPGLREIEAHVCRDLVSRVRSGGRLLWESGLGFSSENQVRKQLQVLNEGLGLTVLPPITARGYVEYEWPVRKLVRTFEFVTPVECPAAEVIARCEGVPVGFRRKMAQGWFIYLGSMLGPGLFAEEREALSVGAGLVSHG